MFSAKDIFLTKAKAGGYTIAKSLRFRSSASAYLSRTPGTAGNRKTWTWSGWVKLGSVGTGTYNIFGGGTAASNWGGIEFDGTSSTISVRDFNGTGNDYQIVGTPVYRDYSAWYHLVVKFDDTQATSSSRLVIYINGTQIAVTGTYPVQNTDYRVNNTVEHRMMRYMGGAANYIDGYLTEINFIDGQALDPTYFGQTDTATGVWMPKACTGSYGTNGFYLKFADASAATAAAIGKDSSPNGNNWTPNNISVTAGVTYDSMYDTPTNYDNGVTGAGNYCVWNPIDVSASATYANANLQITSVSASIIGKGSIGVSSGKWYWEITCVSGDYSGVGARIGLDSTTTPATNAASVRLGNTATSYAYLSWTGNKANNGVVSAYGSTYTTNDIISLAVDLDNGKIWWAKNGTWIASGDPAAGTNAAFTNLSGSYTPAAATDTGAGIVLAINAGQRPFTYTPPSGFKALCTQNLPTPTIGATSSTLASAYFNVSTWTGTGSSTTIPLGSFTPDLVWWKCRNVAEDHHLIDAVRAKNGGTYYASLSSNLTAAEDNTSSGDIVTNITSSGLVVDNINGTPNVSTRTYVGWQWKANGSGSSNTSGTITSTVSANVTAGFSVVTYTGTGANATVGHGLGVAPKMVIVKPRSNGTDGWAVYHASIGNGGALYLESTVATQSSAIFWNNTTPTSSVFSIGTANRTNGSTYSMVAYCFAEVAGYSKFGSYTGNGSADGPFCYTGFQPRYVLVKTSTLASQPWYIFDTSRQTYNSATNPELYPNTSAAEVNSYLEIDILSNGFKVKSTGTGMNSNGATYIYAAFAAFPFNYSRGR